MASKPCACCNEPMFDPNFMYRLSCGNEVCDSCYHYDFAEGELCDRREPGTSPDCLDCIFAMVESGPGYLVYSDADPGL